MNIRGIYTGCVNTINPGDRIMYDLFLQMLRRRILDCGATECKMVSGAEIEPDAAHIDKSMIGVVGGGTLVHWCETSYTSPVTPDIPGRMMFGTGIHPEIVVSDELHSDLANRMYGKLHAGRNVAIDHNLANVAHIKHGGWRGPISSRIEVGNRGYIYDPALLARDYYGWSGVARRDVVVIDTTRVVGPDRLGIVGETPDEFNVRVMKVLCRVARELVDNGMYVECRSPSLYKGILEGKSVDPTKVRFDRQEGYCGMMKQYANADVVIGVPLHTNILAWSAQTPAVSIGYGVKAYDFAESIGQHDLVVPASGELSVDGVLAAVRVALSDWQARVAHVDGCKELARSFYDIAMRNMLNDAMDTEVFKGRSVKLRHMRGETNIAKFEIIVEGT